MASDDKSEAREKRGALVYASGVQKVAKAVPGVPSNEVLESLQRDVSKLEKIEARNSGKLVQSSKIIRADTLQWLTHRDLEQGIAANAAIDATVNVLSRDDVGMIIPNRTLERRIAEGAPLKIEEADGIARLVRVVNHARRAFGDNNLADEWLHSPNPALNEQVPIRMARTDLGGREVEAVLGRIEHGVFG